jgi:hypothetical protein
MLSSPMPGCTPMQKAQKAQNAGWLAGSVQKYSSSVSGAGELRGSPAGSKRLCHCWSRGGGKDGRAGVWETEGASVAILNMALCMKRW